MPDRVDRITDASEAIRAVLEERTVLLKDGITQNRIHPGWVGPIAWELAEAAVDALDAETPAVVASERTSTKQTRGH